MTESTEGQQAEKPAITDMPPETGEQPPTDQQEHEADLQDEVEPQSGDDTIDAGEQEEPRHEDLPEGATREDYDSGADQPNQG